MRHRWLGLLLALCLPFAAAYSQYQGLPIRDLRIANLSPEDEKRLLELLPIKLGQPYRADQIRQSIERLYVTLRFAELQVDAERVGDGVRLTFLNKENFFIGGVSVEGVPAPPRDRQLEGAARMDLGTVWTQEKEDRAIDSIRRLLDDNGLYQAHIDVRREPDPNTRQMDIRFLVTPGERARIGEVRVTGTPLLPPETILKPAKLKPGQKVTARRLQSAVARVQAYYQKKNYLQAKVGIAERHHLPDKNRVALTLEADAGPLVEMRVAGAKISARRRRHLIPVYQEGAVDPDLVREGADNLRDHFQRQGRFEAQIVSRLHPDEGGKKILVEYHVDPGPKHKVASVEIRGNRYFSSQTLRERMFTSEASLFYPGRFSRDFLKRDEETIRNLYVANGFEQVKITSDTLDQYRGKSGNIAVILHVEEGPQTLVRRLTIEGNQQIAAGELRGLVACGDGQPYSAFKVSQDREMILTYYVNRGFSQANLTTAVKPAEGQPNRVDLAYTIAEGQRRYVDQVLVGGLENTRRHIVEQQVQVEPGEALSQVDMLETQQRLYELGIFQKVDMAVQNPAGREPYKNVVFEVEEARRWTLRVGGGADVARFGGSTASLANPAGRFGVSPRVSFEATRLNFRGLDHTVAFKSALSTLQKRALVNYTAPRVWRPDLDLSFDGLFDRSFDILTFASRRLEGSLALKQRLSKSDTVFYRYAYRRVNVDADTLKVSVQQFPLLSRPARVGMLGASFVRDRRDDPAESHRGMFLTFDGGISARQVGSEASFVRAILQFTSYHPLHRTWVLARNTQFGMAEPFGTPRAVQLLQPDGQETTVFTRDLPLPERFFSGGGSSHRGFGVNQAGPRDLATGFPIGGDALLMNSIELRFPLIGPNIGGVVFHDMGNVFDRLRDLSFRVRQKNLTDFNYLVQAAGFGVRYRTPIGPVRLDFAYSINPPSFYGLTGTVQQLLAGGGRRDLNSLGHFQFFFSIGQTY
jgi:outer membrane protein assembly complex protein YaeT